MSPLAAPPRTLTILQVEDSAENRALVSRVLGAAGHRVVDAVDGDEALAIAEEIAPDLILMDLHLPGMDGFEVTARLKSVDSLAHVPVVAVTANVLAGNRERCLRAGCDGYIKKPINVSTFVQEVWAYFDGKQEQVVVAEPSASWTAADGRPTAITEPEPNLPVNVLMEWLDHLERATAAPFGYRRGHGSRTAIYAAKVGRRLGIVGPALATLVRGCRLHDLGKPEVEMRYRDDGSFLSSEAWQRFAGHPRAGAELLAAAPGLSGEVAIIHHHHEKWDGTGYPDGLRGEEIPRLAQVCSVAEAFDAMVTRSTYRPDPLTAEAAAMELERCRGSQFAPRVVNAFTALIAEGKITAPQPQEG